MTLLEVAEEIEAIRDRIRRNVPKHNKPDAFHEEKSEITAELTKLADKVRRGK
ncbi:MAG: hypothetical protein AB7F39_06705 [Variibacter sp.]